jgi:CBS domain-containing protein
MFTPIKNLKVHEIMVVPVICSGPATSVNDIAAKLHENKISGLPIIDENKHVVGIVTSRDILQILLQGKDPNTILAEDVMTRNVISAEKESFVIAAIKSITDNQIMRLPITEEGKLIGIITRHDILKTMIGKAPSFFSIS